MYLLWNMINMMLILFLNSSFLLSSHVQNELHALEDIFFY